MRIWFIAAIVLVPLTAGAASQSRIDRYALVTRHNVVLTRTDPSPELQVGNGGFAFGVDVTGMQTFYGNTMSQWGWHSFPPPAGTRPEDFRYTEWDTYGREVKYPTDAKGQAALYVWLRENPHRLNLGRIALFGNGRPVARGDVSDARQELDLWRGLITSQYKLSGEPLQVQTCCDPSRDLIAVSFSRPMTIELSFPYGSPASSGADWSNPAAHKTVLALAGHRADFARRLDAATYSASLGWTGTGTLTTERPHAYLLGPVTEFVCAFSAKYDTTPLPTFADVQKAAGAHWESYWNSGGAIDLSASKDPRWNELERRIVLSQYLEAIQSAGSLPPPETGLAGNSWYGKFHLEMHWWHGVHFALWNRWPLFERSLGWYQQILPMAQSLAKSQGYRGARWPKCCGPDGVDIPSGTGPLLIWEQPHPIYYANLEYRLHPTPATLQKWRDIVFASADFMASYAVLDKTTGYYVLGPPLKTVPEDTDPRKTRDPTFELSYWRFGLRTAQAWRQGLGLPRDPEWDQVLKGLAPLPQDDGVYISQEGMTDTYTKWNYEHPSLIGASACCPATASILS